MRMMALFFAAVVALIAVQKGLAAYNSGSETTKLSVTSIDTSEIQIRVGKALPVMMVEDPI